MIDKVQYGDINRFLSSIGLVLVALGFLLPYLYMKENFDLLIKKEELNALTDTARIIITYRQEYAHNLVIWIPYVSPGSILAGIALFIIGLINWHKRQKSENAKLDADIDKTRAETGVIMKQAEKLSQSDVKEKQIKEIEKNNPELSLTEKHLSISNYQLVEALITDKFRQEYSDKYNVHSNYRINNQEFDIILERIKTVAEGLNLNKDVIIEIKYAKKIYKKLVKDTFLKIASMLKAYPNAITNPVIMFISVEGDNINKDELLGEIVNEWSEKTVAKWSVHFLSLDELPTLKLKDILSL